MTSSGDAIPVTVALIGNPNTGKSTLFNALSGVRQQTGNYPGVTVEKKEGRTVIAGRPFVLIDLPGTYSLAPRSPDEMIAVDVLLGRRSDVPRPDLILCIVDASNLERNLYIVSQVLEFGLPTVIALNMIDVAADKGVAFDLQQLAKRLGVTVVPVQANRKTGLDELKSALVATLSSSTNPIPPSPFPEAFQCEVAQLENLERTTGEPVLPRYLLERLLLDTTGYLAAAKLPGTNDAVLAEVRAARERLAKAGLPVPGVEAMARYRWVSQTLDGIVTRPTERKVTASDRLDRFLTHRIWGTVVFILFMALMFQAVYLVAEPASYVIDLAKSWLGEFVRARMDDGPLRSLLLKGVIAGVGGVLVFLPQIFTLFFFIAILEDCGYMARAAYLMDRLMSRIGLSGKSFIPLLSSFACAVPGIMATRVIENPRDRLVTILIAPLMSCSARVPVYTLLVGAFIPNQRLLGPFITLPGVVTFAMYAIGVLAAICMALVLKRTVLKGETPPFVMELPSYKWPGFFIVLYRMVERGWAFVRRAGTLILAASIIVWGAAYYPHNVADISDELLAQQAALESQVQAHTESLPKTDGQATEQPDVVGEKLAEELAAINAEIEGEHLRHSFLGRLGRMIEPAVRPLGWDWRLGCAAIASFPAREVVVASLGVIYNLGDEVDEESIPLRETLREARWDHSDRPVFNIPVALSLMVFFSLCAQCVSTLVIMRRETNSWRWPVFTFVYMTTLAYFGAMLTYQVGMFF